MSSRRRVPSSKDFKQREASLERGHLAELCPTTGKRSWKSRKAARAIAKRIHSTGPRLNAYACGDHWHIGHVPQQVRQGWRDRREVIE